ncbi:hypothetical protein [Nostoc sp. PCC 7107]|nr:hypothetical protein [Nostoc sp. PCC 7107]
MAPESTLEKVLELLEDEEDMLVMKSQAQKLTVLYLGMNISKKERGR